MIQVRLATEKDVKDVLVEAFKLDAFYGHCLNDKKIQEEKNKIKESLDSSLLFIASADNRIIGYLMAEFLDSNHRFFPNSIFISDLFVEEEFRKQGIGKKLVKFALTQKYPLQYEYFSVTHSPKASWLTKYYKSFGFKENGVTEVGNVKLTKPV